MAFNNGAFGDTWQGLFEERNEQRIRVYGRKHQGRREPFILPSLLRIKYLAAHDRVKRHYSTYRTGYEIPNIMLIPFAILFFWIAMSARLTYTFPPSIQSLLPPSPAHVPVCHVDCIHTRYMPCLAWYRPHVSVSVCVVICIMHAVQKTITLTLHARVYVEWGDLPFFHLGPCWHVSFFFSSTFNLTAE